MQGKPTVALSLTGSSELFRAIAAEVRELGWQALDLRLTKYIIPKDPPPIGAIINHWPKESLFLQCRKLGCPMVKIGPRNPEKTDELPRVEQDWAACGTLAADYFGHRGLKHLAFIGNDPWAGGEELYLRFREQARSLNCQIHLLRLDESLSKHSETQFEQHMTIIGDWLRDLPKPVGLLAYHDWMGSKVCSICMMNGMAVPEDVAILGIGNNVSVCDLAPTPISSIDQNEPEVARSAVSLLQSAIEKHSAPSPILVEPKGVVERQSTDVIGVPDPRVALAIRFLWNNIDSSITVDDVVAKVGGSRRSLERAFKKHLDRGKKEELLRKRMEVCATLLLETNRTIADIAFDVGIESLAYLHKKFRTTYGFTPQQYRLNRGKGIFETSH